MPENSASAPASGGSTITVVFFGKLSDRLGARKVGIFSTIFSIVWAFPFFFLLNTANPVLIVIAMTLSYAIGWGALAGSQTKFLPELFEARYRFSGVAITREINAAALQGPAPLIAVALLGVLDGQPWLIAVYLMVSAALSLVGMLLGKKTAERGDEI